MTDEEIIEFLIENSDYFKTSSFIGDAGRQISWGLLKFLKYITDSCQNIFSHAFDLLNFTRSNVFVNFWNEYEKMITPMLILFVAVLGFKLIFNIDRKPIPILKNVFILLVVVTSMTTIIPFMNDSVIALKNGVLGDGIETTEADDIINASLWDLTYIDKKNGLSEFDCHYASINADRIKNLDIVAKVTDDDDGISGRAEQIYGKMLVDDGTGEVTGNYELGEIKSSLLGLIDPPYYYRYRVDYPSAIIALIALLIVFLFYTFQVIKLLFEIITAEVLAVVFAPDIGNGEKINKIINSIIGAFTTLAIMVLLVKVYTLFVSYVWQNSYGPIQKSIYMLAISFAVIIGPNIVQRVTGYDMGIGQDLTQMYFAGKMGAAAGKALGKGARAIAGRAISMEPKPIFGGKGSKGQADGTSKGDAFETSAGEPESQTGSSGSQAEYRGDSPLGSEKDAEAGGSVPEMESGDMVDGGINVMEGNMEEDTGTKEETYEPQGWYGSEEKSIEGRTPQKNANTILGHSGTQEASKEKHADASGTKREKVSGHGGEQSMSPDRWTNVSQTGMADYRPAENKEPEGWSAPGEENITSPEKDSHMGYENAAGYGGGQSSSSLVNGGQSGMEEYHQPNNMRTEEWNTPGEASGSYRGKNIYSEDVHEGHPGMSGESYVEKEALRMTGNAYDSGGGWSTERTPERPYQGDKARHPAGGSKEERK
ncbi:pLS20_p028 family conjugation system transmembrane protein [Roseburia hominis]